MNLTVADERLYVPEYFNDRVQVFSLDGISLKTIGSGGDGKGQFSAPGGVGVLPGGDLLVADFHNHRIQRLTAEGDFVRQWGATGETGTAAGAFTYPTDVAVAGGGGFFVADGYNDRVQAFGPEGAFRIKWGGPFAMNVHGPFNGWFATVTGIAIGPEGRVFVADFYNDRVQVFRPDGTFLTAFGESGDGPAQFNHAIALDVAADGTVYVADFLNDRVQIWEPET
jgi:DNA-binding beta-propeller fold protein YncE